MAKSERSGGVPAIDLQSVKLTLEYIYGDVKDVGQLRRVAVALKSAIEEIEAVETSPGEPPARAPRGTARRPAAALS